MGLAGGLEVGRENIADETVEVGKGGESAGAAAELGCALNTFDVPGDVLACLLHAEVFGFEAAHVRNVFAQDLHALLQRWVGWNWGA